MSGPRKARNDIVIAVILEEVGRKLEQPGAEFIAHGVRRRMPARREGNSPHEELRAISFRSAARLQGGEAMTERDLYDEDGLPA